MSDTLYLTGTFDTFPEDINSWIDNDKYTRIIYSFDELDGDFQQIDGYSVRSFDSRKCYTIIQKYRTQSIR